jgi:hypothetical protein
LQIESNAVAGCSRRLNDSFIRAVELIYACRGAVIVSGIGKSVLSAKDRGYSDQHRHLSYFSSSSRSCARRSGDGVLKMIW